MHASLHMFPDVVLGGHLSDCGNFFLWSPSWGVDKPKTRTTFFKGDYKNPKVLKEAEEFDVVGYAKEGAWSK